MIPFFVRDQIEELIYRHGGSFLHWLPSGILKFTKDGDSFEVDIDPVSLRLLVRHLPRWIELLEKPSIELRNQLRAYYRQHAAVQMCFDDSPF